jgi:putative heme iron utilization protein
MRGVRIAFQQAVKNPAETRKVFVDMLQQARARRPHEA